MSIKLTTLLILMSPIKPFLPGRFNKRHLKLHDLKPVYRFDLELNGKLLFEDVYLTGHKRTLPREKKKQHVQLGRANLVRTHSLIHSYVNRIEHYVIDVKR